MVIKFHKACILLTRSSFCIGLFFVIFFIAYYALWFLLDLNETFSSSHYKLKVASAMKRDFAIEEAQIKPDENLSESAKFLKYIAFNVSIKYDVLSNFNANANVHVVTLQNNGEKPIPKGNSIDWAIYFNSLHLLEYDVLQYTKSVQLESGDFKLTHIDGGFFKFTPTSRFSGIEPKDKLRISFQSYITVSRDYVLPCWYVSTPTDTPWIIHSTDGVSPEFVTEFTSDKQWKRSALDLYEPFTLEKRFFEYVIPDAEEAPLRIVPTPLSFDLNEEKLVYLDRQKWIICHNPVFKREIELLSALLKVSIVSEGEPCQPSNVIRFSRGIVSEVKGSNEAYKIEVDSDAHTVNVCANGAAGAFYAVQTLFSLAEFRLGKSTSIPSGVIFDSPRFEYRGLHVDVARNFIKLDDLLLIIKSMGIYKLNKLHLHLTDDEGWRIEIEGLPELTQIGSVRRHSEKEDESLFPALGSGPFDTTSGSGFYSISDYQKILKVAAANHVQVIPEIDMPGHCHAAIRSMEARYRRLSAEGKEEEAQEFLLSDPNDKSRAMSVQHFRNNAINPCIESTYKFVSHVIGELQKMHDPIQPLRIIHVGGDEVSKNSWAASPICSDYIKAAKNFPMRTEDLQEHFMRRVSKLCKTQFDLTMAVWEDGALKSHNNEPYDKASLNDCEVVAYAWNNNWKRSTASRAHKLANAGYKVVMAHATHLYFDHPQEPDPKEKGLTWAARYIDDRKVFDFRPDDLFGNAKKDFNGFMFSDEEVDKIRESHPPLTAPQNIIGMQANLWSEMLRDMTMVHSQLFPRLIAFAERAWHKAVWEKSNTRDMRLLRNKDWNQFANVVGYKELPRLKKMEIGYRIPPPGVNIIDGKFQLSSMYPGFKFFYRPINAKQAYEWKECKNGQAVPNDHENYEFVTSDGLRMSRIVK